MAEPERKKIARFKKSGSQEMSTQRFNVPVIFLLGPLDRVQIFRIILVALSCLIAAVLFHNEYLFWKGIETPEKSGNYYFINYDGRQAEAINKLNSGDKAEKHLEPDLKIAVIADVHVGFQHGYAHLKKFTDIIGGKDPDLIIDAGDLIESRDNYKRLPGAEAEKEIIGALDILNINYPVHHTIGNHEVFSLDKNKISRLTGEKNYYNFYFKGYNIIILDTNFTMNGKDIDPTNVVPGADRGSISKTQLEWLSGNLSNYNQNIIISHHPLYNLKNSSDLLHIIKKYHHRIAMTANGHRHRADTLNFGGVKNYDIPSLWWQEGAYAFFEVNGLYEKVWFE